MEGKNRYSVQEEYYNKPMVTYDIWLESDKKDFIIDNTTVSSDIKFCSAQRRTNFEIKTTK